MGTPRTQAAITVNSATGAGVVPALQPGTAIPAVSFSISGGIATVVLNVADAPGAVFPTNGYNGPNGYPDIESSGAPFNIGAYFGGGASGGQKVALWGFTTATYFNGKVVTVLDNNPTNGSFRFYFNHANVSSTNDAGNTQACPFQHYRTVRIELDSSATDTIYVGDSNVSTSRYVTALSTSGQISVEIASENIQADQIWLINSNTGSTGTDSVHVSFIY